MTAYVLDGKVSTHSRPKAAGLVECDCMMDRDVSTHSRPKAAGHLLRAIENGYSSFNTQPPEGGWACGLAALFAKSCFNTQPPEGGWPNL